MTPAQIAREVAPGVLVYVYSLITGLIVAEALGWVEINIWHWI